MIDNLTTLDRIVLTSIFGSFLGNLSALIINTIYTVQTERKIRYKWIKEAFLTSIAIGLFTGCLAFGFGSFDVQSVETTTPLSMFIFTLFLSFFSGAIDSFIKVFRLIF